MPDEKVAAWDAHRIELVIRRLDSISILPAVAVQLYTKLLEPQFSPSSVVDIIEMDAGLAAGALSLVNRQGLDALGEKFSLRNALSQIPSHLVRDALFSIKVFGASDPENRAAVRKEIAVHNLAVACCAEGIAEVISPRMDPRLAYCAGLLHDIGKLALEEVMPKSFADIVEQADSAAEEAYIVERRRLGIDHTIIGKRLAQKWGLANLLTLAVWLHHSDTIRITQSMPEARLAEVVQLADVVAHQSGVSGPERAELLSRQAELLAAALSISPEHLEKIRQRLPDNIRQKSEMLGLSLPNAAATYRLAGMVHAAAVRFAGEQAKTSLENQKLETASKQSEFIKDFLLSIDSSDSVASLAENFAVRWQKFYQTGMVCLYLPAQNRFQPLEAVVVENLSKTNVFYLDVPDDRHAIPAVIERNFAVLDAHDYIDWLFEQLDVEFDISRTKLMPLIAGGRAVGAIVFELRYPADVELFLENFRISASVAATVLDMACACRKQQHYAEQFSQHLAQAGRVQPTAAAESCLDALVEMAAGAAHELNNPLTVISGRAQLLNEIETDQQKKLALKQIQENTGKISALIEELMSIARPSQPRAAETNIRQLLDEAVQLTRQKTGVEHINIQMVIDEDTPNVFIDSAQIASAVANVLTNAVESYTDSLGPIKVTAVPERSPDKVVVKLQISDLGCGMDAETLQKATHPFFSAKPAGRKRGMGLAYADRVIRLNRAGLDIKSQPGIGTTVTIILPCRQRLL